MAPSSFVHALEADGFALQTHAYPSTLIHVFLAAWNHYVIDHPNPAILRTKSGAVYGARNLMNLWPPVISIAFDPSLRSVASEILGPGYGLVRVLFFDKPPAESWALPWHKDLSIAVADNSLPSSEFEKSTTKYGVPHVEAPEWLLQQMLTARLHLDDVDKENGPLLVQPGSHRVGKGGQWGEAEHRAITCSQGDVLWMRPLLAHASGHSREGTQRHRRILHFEFAAVRELPDGYRWHDFQTGE